VLENNAHNPWLKLGLDPPFVLESDWKAVEAFNARVDPELRLHTELLPEPFVGDVKAAAVLLLNMNPAYSPAEFAFHRDPSFVTIARANLTQRVLPYPFYFLDPHWKSPGHRYWSWRLAELIDVCGREAVAKHVAVVEWYPYHSLGMSRTWMPRVPSQAFSFKLVQDALERGAVIIIIRAVKWWQQELPGLVSGAKRLDRNYRRAGSLLRRACPEAFDLAVKAIRRFEQGDSR
jgi:hypothetical protein